MGGNRGESTRRHVQATTYHREEAALNLHVSETFSLSVSCIHLSEVCIDSGITHHADRWVAALFQSVNFLSQSNISHIDVVSLFAVAYQEIVRLDVSMNEPLK